MENKQDWEITHSEEYREYLEALCTLASQYVVRIRKQFCQKAYEKYKDETTRRIVLEYGREQKKLVEKRINNFIWEAAKEDPTEGFLEDDILNNAGGYASTIYMLFDIE